MLKRLLAVLAALAMLAVVPAAASADPPEGSASELRGQGRLDLYVIETTADVAAAMRAEGYDVVSETVDGETVIVEVIMSPGEANKARRAYDLDISLKRNKKGQTTAQAAFEEAENGFEVWRQWSEPGGHRDEMEFLAAQYDDLTELITIGQSLNGEPIYAMRITEKADTKRRGSRPAVLNISAQHAREWISPEVNTRLMRYYLENYGTDERVTDILDTTEVWFVIVANPDGYDWTFTEGNRLWRKNLRDNNGDGQITTIDGVDLNRNFATNWGQDNEGSSDNPTSQVYRGTAPTSEPETVALDGLMARYDFSFLVNYHSAAELLLYGTGNQVDSPTPDDLLNIAINGTDENPGVADYDPDLSAELYITNGTTTGHAVGAYGIMAYTPELATCQTATTYDPDDEFGPTYCRDEGRSGFEFPDSEALVQFEFEKNLNYQLVIAESAADPANPSENAVGSVPDFEVKAFTESWGADQEVAVWTRREVKQLRMNYSINGGRTVSRAISEWGGGERYGNSGNVWYAEYRGTVTGQQAGDSVEVWFTAVDTPSGGGDQQAAKIESEHFTYNVVTASGADVLIVSDNSPGTFLGGVAPLDYLSYYTNALDANGVSYEVFDVGTTNIPHPMGVLNHFDAVIWYTGDKLVTDYQGGLNTTYVAHELNMSMRDYLNEGGKVLATGKNHGFEEFFPLNYGENGAPTQPCTSGNCLVMTDDVYQYWFGGYSRSRRGGLAPDRTAYDVAGTGGAFDGYSFGLDGGDSADNQGAPGAASTGTASFVVTNSVLPSDEFPLLPVSERLARWETGGGAPFEPVTGDWQVATDHDDVAYKRLSTVIDVPAGATTATFDFATSYAIESDWDYLFVEAHTVGADDWTTLPDANGHTSQSTGQSCPAGWATQLHPWLFRYQDAACNPTGTTGAWNAATGPSSGIEQWSIDLSAYAGSSVEVSITFATDWATGDLGVFVDDVSVNIDGVESQATSFEAGLDFFNVPGSPEGSAPNAGDWERVGILYEIASIVATEDTLLFGFGFEGISTAGERNEVMARSLQHLGLG